jgi:nitronate monooxygenase
VFTDPASSPTGFPFKTVQLEGSTSDEQVYLARVRICDLGYLRELYATDQGVIGYRCPAEPEDNYVNKDGKVAKTLGKKCLCNSLLANIGQPQVRRDNYVEEGLVTAGDDLVGITRFFPPDGTTTYSAADVISTLCSSSLVAADAMPAYPAENVQFA